MQYGHGKYMLIRHTHSLYSVGEKRIASKKMLIYDEVDKEMRFNNKHIFNWMNLIELFMKVGEIKLQIEK